MEYKIKKLRENMGLTQDDLAKKSGVNRTTIVYLESGKEVNVTAGTLKKIAKCLNVDIKEIFV